MGCDCCKFNDKLEKLFTFLGVYICYECKGKGRIEKITCCDRETITCPECKGNEFIIEEDSILKSLIDEQNNEEEHDDLLGIGLCD